MQDQVNNLLVTEFLLQPSEGEVTNLQYYPICMCVCTREWPHTHNFINFQNPSRIASLGTVARTMIVIIMLVRT